MGNYQRILFLLTTMALGACAASPAALQEHLDRHTGVTVFRASAPLVFYKDSSARAAHARDYVYAGPIEIDRMGEIRYFMWLGIWSTMPVTEQAEQRDGFESVTIFADGEPLSLVIAGWNESAIGAEEAIYGKPVASAADAFYEVTLDQLRLIAQSRDLRLLTSGPRPAYFEPWDREQSAMEGLRRFVEHASF